MLDSGVGGLTVLAPMLQAMPGAQFIYYADSAWCPYGPRSMGEVCGRVELVVQGLLSAGCSMVVLACNTATAAAIAMLRRRYAIPFVGMEPAIKPAALQSVTRVIGVLATHGTIRGERFQQQVELYGREVEIIQVAGDGLVELVEQGLCDAPEAERRVRELVEPMVLRGIDYLVLGCTHYPFLIRTFTKVLPSMVTVVNPAVAVARQAVRVYAAHGFSVEGNVGGIRVLLVSSGLGSGLRGRLYSYIGQAAAAAVEAVEVAGVEPGEVQAAARSLVW